MLLDRPIPFRSDAVVGSGSDAGAVAKRVEALASERALADHPAHGRRRVGAFAPHPLKLLLSPLNQNENQPGPVGPLHVARTLSLARNLPLRTYGPTWQTTVGPDSRAIIVPTNTAGPPAPTTFHVPLAVIGKGGSTLLPTNEPLAATSRCNPKCR